jgi:PAS domain S-box-containing protein
MEPRELPVRPEFQRGSDPGVAAAGGPARNHRAAGAGRPRILWADAEVRDDARRLLEPRYEVCAVSDGERALRAARARPPDLVLSEAVLPRMDRLELLLRLRADPATREVPVILLSARAGEEARVEGLEAGADDYLVKPFAARELLARVGGALALARVRREARLREAELRDDIAGALEGMTDGFMAVDGDWRLTYVNAAAERTNGVPRGSLLGKTHWEAFPDVVGTDFERGLRQAMASRQPFEAEIFFEPYGRWFRMNVHPAKNGGLAFYGRDISERKEAEAVRLRLQRERDELLERLRLQFERMPIACIVFDGQRIIDWNPAAEATFGWRREEVLGKEGPRVLVTPVVRRQTEDVLRRLFQGDMVAHSVNENVTRDGRTIVCEWHNTPLLDAGGAVAGIMSMAQDVTERRRAEEALHQLTTRLELATRGSDIGIFELEFPDGTFPSGRAVFSNVWEQLGYGRREPLPDFAAGLGLSHPDDRARQEGFFRSYLAGESGHLEFEHRLRHRDGSYRTLLVRGVAIREPGKPVRVVGSRVDITRRKRAEQALRESEERFRGAFEAAAIGFAVVETDGRFRAVNRTMCDMLGYGEAELLAMAWPDVTHPDDLERDRPLRARLMAGEIESFQLDKRYIHKRGHVVWGQLAVSLVRDAAGAPAYTVAQVTDVTARREAEQALARHAADLERSNAELEQFAAIASHDLQEPLRAVASYVQLLDERYQGKLDERADRWIGYTVAAVERMRRLIAGLLALAQVRTERGALAPASLEGAVERAWEHLRPRHDGSRARLTHDALPTLVADRTQLEQLFQNLLGNAIKYRRPGVPPHIHVSAERRAGEAGAQWELGVHDNGIGLKVEDAGRIFEIFQRLHRDDEYEGAGMGLAICKKIVERHGGRIWVESAPGEGASFRFTLAERPG